MEKPPPMLFKATVNNSSAKFIKYETDQLVTYEGVVLASKYI